MRAGDSMLGAVRARASATALDPHSHGGMLLADRIIFLLYGQKFAPAIPVLQIMVWALPFIFLSEILGRASITMHLEKKMTMIVFVNALITVTLDVVLIPRLGVVGAAIAMVISGLVSVLQSTIMLDPAMLFKGNLGPLLRVGGAAAFMGGVVWLVRDASFLAPLGGKIALLLVIGVGAIVYTVAAVLLRAINPSEEGYIYNMA